MPGNLERLVLVTIAGSGLAVGNELNQPQNLPNTSDTAIIQSDQGRVAANAIIDSKFIVSQETTAEATQEPTLNAEPLSIDVLNQIKLETPESVKSIEGVHPPDDKYPGYYRTRADGRVEVWYTGHAPHKDIKILSKIELGWQTETSRVYLPDLNATLIFEQYLDPNGKGLVDQSGHQFDAVVWTPDAQARLAKLIMESFPDSYRNKIVHFQRVEFFKEGIDDSSGFVKTYTKGDLAMGIEVRGNHIFARYYENASEAGIRNLKHTDDEFYSIKFSRLIEYVGTGPKHYAEYPTDAFANASGSMPNVNAAIQELIIDSTSNPKKIKPFVKLIVDPK